MSQSSDGPAKVAGATYTRAGQDYFQKRTLKRSAGVWGLWGLAVAAVISGDFSGWNFGIDFAGFGGMLIAFVILVAMYYGMIFSIGEMASAMPGCWRIISACAFRCSIVPSTISCMTCPLLTGTNRTMSPRFTLSSAG